LAPALSNARKGKVVVTGAAGLVGQNLIPRLFAKGFTDIVAIDKHPTNTAILEQQHPTLKVLRHDLAESGSWEEELAGCHALVVGQAQIGGTVPAEFARNNIFATELLLAAAVRHRVPYIVGISSSVVNSKAVDDYTETKKAQEKLFDACPVKHIVLRPTLMFGWFDRKHVGWLARFMKKTPLFPIPSSGKFLRQPLFAGDFCNVIVASIERELTGTYDITGQERIDYIDLIRAVKHATGSTSLIQKVPYNVFWLLLKINAIFDKDPAFTVKQLKALVTPDIFDVIDWPGIFQVRATPLQEALEITFRDPVYSQIVLHF
jgi:nucleoside-diphosphate-sugar epimerase